MTEKMQARRAQSRKAVFVRYCLYTKHHLKYGKNQADNLEYIGFRRRFFPVFYWCLVLKIVFLKKSCNKNSEFK